MVYAAILSSRIHFGSNPGAMQPETRDSFFIARSSTPRHVGNWRDKTGDRRRYERRIDAKPPGRAFEI